jgi:hypothetical protein
MALTDLYSRENGSVPLTHGVPDAATRRDLKRMWDQAVLLDATVDALDATVTALDATVDALPRGTVAFVSSTADPAGGIVAVTDIAGISVTFTPLVGRRYRAAAGIRVAQATNAALQEAHIRNSGGTTLNKTTISVAVNEIAYHTPTYVWVEASGASLTLKLSVSATNASADPFGAATQPIWLLVEDVGT